MRLKERILNIIRFNKNDYRSAQMISMEEAKNIIGKNPNVVLIDVRSMQEYKEYHINGAICIPHYEIGKIIESKVKNKSSMIILYCQSGIRSLKAMKVLSKLGYTNLYNIRNGLDG